MKLKIRTICPAFFLIAFVVIVCFMMSIIYFHGSCTLDGRMKHLFDYRIYMDSLTLDTLNVSNVSAKQLLSDSGHDSMNDKFDVSAERTNARVITSLASNISPVYTLSPALLESYNNELLAKLESQNAMISYLSKTIINNHMFSYIHQPLHACSDTQTEVLLVVPSAPGNFERRSQVRKDKSAVYARNPRNKAKMLFFIGVLPDNKKNLHIQRKVDEEVEKYGDIVQENFEDIYRNIRLKAVSMLRWAVTFCQHAHYVIRLDDDVRVNPARLVAAVKRTRDKYVNFILGVRRENRKPLRKAKNKYFLSVDEYPLPNFPPFLLGGLLGYPLSTAKLLYHAALREKPIWLDDVYITGMCARKVNVPLIEDPDFHFEHKW